MNAGGLPLGGSHSGESAARAAARLCGLSVLLLFTMSTMLLSNWGVNYDTPGGSIIEKMHPGTWVAALALFTLLLSQPAPLNFVNRLCGHFSGTFAFLAAWCVLLFQIIVVQRVPFTPVIDTFLLPVMLLILCANTGEDDLAKIAGALHAIMAANAVIALIEIATGERLTPLILQGAEFEGEWRATALFGHPLGNACLASCYALLIALSPSPYLSNWLRLPQILLQLIAMTAFGGRAALVGVLLILIAVAAIRLARLVSGNARIDLKAAAAAAIFVPAVIGALILAVELGAFDRLFDRFVNDDGSARTRIIMLQLLASIPLEQLMIGPDQGVIETLKRIEGLDLGIESFWVAFILSYGIMVSVIFFIALGLFMIDVIREAGRAAFVPVLFFFAVASTSVSLSAKSPLLGMFVALLLIIPERRNSVRPEAAGDVSR